MKRKKAAKPEKAFFAIIVIIIILAVASFAYTSNPTGRGYGFVSEIGTELTGSEEIVITSASSCETTTLGKKITCSVTCPDGNGASVTCTSTSGFAPSCDCSCKKEGSSPNDYWVAKCWCKE